MRHVRRLSVPSQWRAAVLPLCAALAFGCHGVVGDTGGGSTTTPLCSAGDPTHVIADQRIGLVTSTQLINMVKLVSIEEAQSVVDNNVFSVTSDIVARFPPPAAEQFRSIPDSTVLIYFNTLAQHVGNYVRDHFAAVTKCATPGTDECALAYLNSLAVKAYRRQLTTEEKDRFTGPTGLYHTLRSQLVNGYQVTTTVEEATGNSVYGLFMTPQLLWRWELGAGVASTSPAGVYLTDAELASNLSYYLTDEPPDDMLIAAAQAGNLRANLAAHVDRIIATPASRAWLTKVMSMYFLLNQLPGTRVDETKFPIVAGGAVYADLEEESRLFLNDVMWKRQGFGPAHVDKGVPQHQSRDDDLRRPGAPGRDGDELRRDDASGRQAGGHVDQRGVHHDARAGGRSGRRATRPGRQGAVLVLRHAAAAGSHHG